MEIEYEVKNLDNSDVIIEKDTKILIPKYTHNKKIELVKKINKIKKKEYLINIFKIINSTSNDYTENNNGIFIFFHNLNDETYEKIETYVNMIYKLHQNTSIKSIFSSELSDNFIVISEMSDTIDDNKELSNKEKMIMRRKKYEEYITHNQK